MSDKNTEVLIIGAGFSGLSTALHLLESKRDIVLIDAHGIGWGASGRNGGHVLPLIRKDPQAIIDQLGDIQGERLIRMVAGAADYVFEMIERYGIDCDAERNGWIQAIHSKQQLQISQSRYQQWQNYAADMQMLNREELQQQMGTDSYLGGLLVKAGGHVNPLALVRGMASAAINKGLTIFTESPAISIKQVGKRWRVKTPEGSIVADKVVLATAAYSDTLWPGLRESCLPFYLYSIATEPLEPALRQTILTGRQPVTDTRGDAYVFHYDRDGRLITGGTFILPFAWKNRLARHATHVLGRIFPQIESPRFEHGYLWRGKVAITSDMLPHLHILAPGVFTWLGCNARGIALSTRMGAVLADAVNGIPEKDWPVQATSLRSVPLRLLSTVMTSTMLGYYRLRDSFS